MIATHTTSTAFAKSMRRIKGGFVLPDRTYGAWLYRPDIAACGPDGKRIAPPKAHRTSRHKRRWL